MSDNAKINSIFAIPVYSVNLADELDIQEIEKMRDKLLHPSTEWYENLYNRFTVDTHYLHTNMNSSLMRAIHKHTKHFFYEVLGVWPEANIFLTESWVNKSLPGDAHHSHTHPNSIVSGSFYFNSAKNCGNLVFQNTAITAIRFPSKSSEFGKVQFEYVPNEYDLVLWPSYIQHYVTRNNSDVTRLCLGLNTFVDGDINNMTLSQLSI